MTTLVSVTDDTTARLLALALNAATAKHIAIAQNIANANNDGYRPLKVDFDAQVALFKDQLLDPRNDAASARVFDALQTAVTIMPAGDEPAKVQLDVEVAKMAQNTVHYEALLSAHNSMAALLRFAINGGR